MSAGSRAGSAAARADRPDAAMARVAVLNRSSYTRTLNFLMATIAPVSFCRALSTMP